MPRSSRHRSHYGHRHDRDRSASPSSADEDVQRPPPPSGSRRRRTDASPSGRAATDVANAAAAAAAVDPSSSADQGGRKRKERDSSKSTAATTAEAGDTAAAVATTGSDRWTGDVRAASAADVDGGLVEDKRIKVEEPVLVAMSTPTADKVAKGTVSGSESRSRAASGKRHSGADGGGGGGKDESGGVSRDEYSRRRADKESSSRRETTDRDRDHRAPEKDHGHGHGSSRNGDRTSDKDRGTHHAAPSAPAHGRDKEGAEQPEHYSKDDKSKRSKERPSNAATTDMEAHTDRDTRKKMQDDLYSSDTERRLKKLVVKDGSNDKGRSKGDGRGSEDRANDLDRNGTYRDADKHRRYRDKSREDADRDRRPRDDRHRVGADRPSRDESNERSEPRYQKDTSKHPENHRRPDKDHESTPSTRDHSVKSMDVRVRKRPFNEKEEPNGTDPRTVVEINALDLDYNSEDKGRPESVHSNRVDSNSRHKQPRRSPNSAVHILEDEYRALSKERNHTSPPSSGDHASISGAAEKALDSYSVESNAKLKGTPHSADYAVEDGLPPKSDSHLSANQMVEKSPISPRDNTDRKGNVSSASPSNIPPVTKQGSGRPSVQGSVEYDGRTQSGDYSRSATRYKRNGDSKMGRGQGGNWNGVPNWPPPVPNGFMPFPHGPPGPFHHVGQQYPTPPMFGVRPPMDFNHACVPFRMHGAPPDRFPGRPFGWHNPSGDSGPQFQAWEGNGGLFGNDAHMFGRGEWEHGRHSNNLGWETSGGMKGLDEKAAMGLDSNNKRPDFSPQVRTDETHTAELENKSNRHLPEHVDMGRKAKPVVATGTKIKSEPALKPSNNDNGPGFLGQLLSKLDISLNLTSPELCMRINLNRKGDYKTGDSRVLKHINGQAGEKLKLGIRGLSHGTRPCLPAIADDIFKKAVSLYKSSEEERVNGMRFPPNTPVENNNEILSTSSCDSKSFADVPSAERGSDTRVADAIELPGSYLQAMDVDNADVKEQEPANTADASNVSPSSGQLSSSYLGKQASGSEFVEKFAKQCVGLIPEFVTRIHSPGSSH